MCRHEKPRMGLLMLAAEWFWQVGAQTGQGRYRELPEIVERDVQIILTRLESSLDLVHSGLVHSVAEAEQAAARFREADVDILVICSVMWSEDQSLIRVLEKMGDVPLILWCYTPEKRLPERTTMPELFRRSGPVGAMQFSGLLRGMGRAFNFVLGPPDDESTFQELQEYAEAAKLVKDLKKVTIGVLPSRCEVMTATFVDEFRLMSELGPKVQYISVQQYVERVEQIAEGEVAAYVNNLKAHYRVAGVSDKTLFQAAQVSLGLGKVAEDFGLDALAINDLADEIHQAFGLRPCLYVPTIFEKGLVVGMEADLAATVGLLILRRLGLGPPMFTEIFTYDLVENTILAGHAGMHDVRIASEGSVSVIPDCEYDCSDPLEGAWMHLTGKPGQVTLLSLVDVKDSFQMIVTCGESLPVMEKLEGFPHMYIKLNVPLRDFFTTIAQAGITQHWAIVHGDVRSKLEKLADYLNLKKLVIE